MKHLNTKYPMTDYSISVHARGFSLIEVLVTVVVMSVGLLGIAGIQLTSLKNNDSAYIRSKSAIYAYNLIDYMRANRNNAIAGGYNVGLSALSDLTAPSGTPTIAQIDRYNWFQHLDSNLPSAKAAINCDATAVCVVKVEWDDSHAEGDDGEEDDDDDGEESTSTKNIVLTAQL